MIPYLNDDSLKFAKYFTFAYVIFNCCLFIIPIRYIFLIIYINVFFSVVLWIQTKNILKDQTSLEGIDK